MIPVNGYGLCDVIEGMYIMFLWVVIVASRNLSSPMRRLPFSISESLPLAPVG